MTDADNLLIGYFRAEYAIPPYQARILRALYAARRALSTADLCTASGVPVSSLKAGICNLRHVMGDNWLAPTASVCLAGRDRQIAYRLTSTGREDIEFGLRTALTALLARLPPERRAA